VKVPVHCFVVFVARFKTCSWEWGGLCYTSQLDADSLQLKESRREDLDP